MTNPKATYQGPFCGAKAKSSGKPCRAPAMANGRCRVHGGATPSGVNSPHWKHGRYVKSMPKTIIPFLEEQAQDADRLSLEKELDLVDARMSLLLESVGKSDGPAAWRALEAASEEFNRAQNAPGPDRVRVARMFQAMQKIQDTIASGAGDAATWGEMMTLIDRRRMLVESVERRAISTGRAIPAEAVLNMFASFARTVVDEITDPTQRRRIAVRIKEIMIGHRLPLDQLPQRVLEAGG